MRLFGFDTQQQQKLALFHEKKAVALSNCKVTPVTGPNLEVLVGRSTEMQRSPTTLNVSTLVCTLCNEITLDQMQGLSGSARHGALGGFGTNIGLNPIFWQRSAVLIS